MAKMQTISEHLYLDIDLSQDLFKEQKKIMHNSVDCPEFYLIRVHERGLDRFTIYCTLFTHNYRPHL